MFGGRADGLKWRPCFKIKLNAISYCLGSSSGVAQVMSSMERFGMQGTRSARLSITVRFVITAEETGSKKFFRLGQVPSPSFSGVWPGNEADPLEV